MNQSLPQHGLVVTSIPKSGTHLLQNILSALPGLRPGPDLCRDIDPHTPREDRVAIYADHLAGADRSDVSIAHFHHSPDCVRVLNALSHRRVFLLRDPKDFIVSYIDYVLDPTSRHFHRPLFEELPDDEARIERVIRGHPGRAGIRYLPGVREYYSIFWGWLADPDTHVVRYEELLGWERCALTLERIVRALGLAYSNDELRAAAAVGAEPKRSVTFRIGKSGRWRQRFSSRLLELYRDETGDLDARVGYSAGWEASEGSGK